jgi:hypothetical protein
MRIETLVPDIYKTVSNKNGWFTSELARDLGMDIADTLQGQLGEERPAPYLRISALGPKCPKQLWHSIHTPELAETLLPKSEIKFSYGHMVEALALTLARASGHRVEGMQDELRVDDVRGHRDAVIDGCIVDIKSSSSIGMEKFKTGSLAEDDSFGYLDQLDGYLCGSLQDPLVTVKDTAYILAIDKVRGDMVLYKHKFREARIRQRIKDYKEIVARDKPPRCECGTRPHGKSGNIELDVRASYSYYKHVCFPHLRTFLYSSGPVYLTHVARVPDVTEVDKNGNYIYH